MAKIFSRKKYKETNMLEDYEENKIWIDFCDGKKINKFYENGDGMIKDFFIAYEWMEESD